LTEILLSDILITVETDSTGKENNMTDTLKLEQKIKDSGLKKVHIIKALGLSYQGFYNKVNNIHYFNVDEVQKLCDMLKINAKEKERIFFN
jgi:hypothetical protein